jgi:hypothetical protein
VPNQALRPTHASTSSTALPRRSTWAKALASASLASSASPVYDSSDRHRRACTERYTWVFHIDPLVDTDMFIASLRTLTL